jgi:hypothetical protein
LTKTLKEHRRSSYTSFEMPFNGEHTGVQYLGISGDQLTCLLAIDAIVNSPVLPDSATVMTCGNKHLFLFWRWIKVPLTVVRSGFASKYSGVGPTVFSLALCIIRDRGISCTRELQVNRETFHTVDSGNISYPIRRRLESMGKREAQELDFNTYTLNEHRQMLENSKVQLWQKIENVRRNWGDKTTIEDILAEDD